MRWYQLTEKVKKQNCEQYKFKWFKTLESVLFNCSKKKKNPTLMFSVCAVFNIIIFELITHFWLIKWARHKMYHYTCETNVHNRAVTEHVVQEYLQYLKMSPVTFSIKEKPCYIRLKMDGWSYGCHGLALPKTKMRKWKGCFCCYVLIKTVLVTLTCNLIVMFLSIYIFCQITTNIKHKINSVFLNFTNNHVTFLAFLSASFHLTRPFYLFVATCDDTGKTSHRWNVLAFCRCSTNGPTSGSITAKTKNWLTADKLYPLNITKLSQHFRLKITTYEWRRCSLFPSNI